MSNRSEGSRGHRSGLVTVISVTQTPFPLTVGFSALFRGGMSQRKQPLGKHRVLCTWTRVPGTSLGAWVSTGGGPGCSARGTRGAGLSKVRGQSCVSRKDQTEVRELVCLRRSPRSLCSSPTGTPRWYCGFGSGHHNKASIPMK